MKNIQEKVVGCMNSPRKFLANSGAFAFHLKVSRRRKSVGLTVTDTGELLVHAPRHLSLAAIHEVIDRNLAWIEKKQAERREAAARLEKGKVYYRGQALSLELRNSGPMGVRLAHGVVQVNLVPPVFKGGLGGICSEATSQDPWPPLLRWYYQQAEILLTGQVRQFAPRMGLAAPPLEVRNWRRRWGECHSDGRLRFNWRLVLLPPESLDSLVVHELAHLLVPGHPLRFWQEVGKYLPDYASRRRWLRLYGAPFLVWKFEPAIT
jgi:predicted metal-dependent hydrolase